MGLIKAAAAAIGSGLGDQWKEFFTCDALNADVLVVKGVKKTSGRSSNNKASENVITNGSLVSVADGQCLLITDQGKIVEFCAEPGEYVFNTATEPCMFVGDLNQGVLDTFQMISKRFTFGGDAAKDQRVYYINTKEIPGNKYGTATPVPFRVVDQNIGLDIDISIRCNGEYSYRIVNPLLFYANVCGNVAYAYTREEIDSMLKTELLTALQPAFAQISAQGVRYSALPGHTVQLADLLNQILSAKWRELRGIEIASFGVNSVTASKEDEDMIKELQKTAVLRNTNMAAATLVEAQAQAMKDAAKNQGQGAFMAFAGMNMAQQAGGANPQTLFQYGQQQQNAPAPTPASAPPSAPQLSAPAKVSSWTCACGALNRDKFCMECGKPAPHAEGWTCTCGTINKGNFCTECGKPAPQSTNRYQCNKCGWIPADPSHPPKFCPECGDVFDANDQT